MEKRVLRDLQEVLPLLPINATVWLMAIKVAQRCRSAGVTAPAADVAIAAGACQHGLGWGRGDGHSPPDTAGGGLTGVFAAADAFHKGLPISSVPEDRLRNTPLLPTWSLVALPCRLEINAPLTPS